MVSINENIEKSMIVYYKELDVKSLCVGEKNEMGDRELNVKFLKLLNKYCFLALFLLCFFDVVYNMVQKLTIKTTMDIQQL